MLEATIPVSRSSDRCGPVKIRSGIGVRRSWQRRPVNSRATADLSFPDLSDEEAVFQFRLHTMPSEEAEHIGTSSIVAAWNAATYVAQIDETALGRGHQHRRLSRRHPPGDANPRRHLVEQRAVCDHKARVVSGGW